MAEASNTTVTLQVHRFTPRPERAERARGGSPFAKKGSPFGGGSDSAARRRPRGKQWVQEYTIPARPSDTVLDCLLTIKRTVDPTLAFRYSCGHGMCGSDAVAINGTPTLLCTATIRDWAKQPGAMPEVDDEGFRHTGTEAEESDDSAENVANAAAAQNSAANGSLGVIELASLPGFPPQRDLIADIDPMLNQIRKLTPYLQADGVLATTAEGKVDVFEYLQNPEQLAKYELLSNCIACGVCEGACPVYAGGDAFIGPAALIWASRFVNDSRDTKAMERMDAIDTADGVAACQSVRACSRHCRAASMWARRCGRSWLRSASAKPRRGWLRRSLSTCVDASAGCPHERRHERTNYGQNAVHQPRQRHGNSPRNTRANVNPMR